MSVEETNAASGQADGSVDYLERLGIAWCRLSNWQWDELLGDKPEGFDDLPETVPFRRFFPKRENCKMNIVLPLMNKIERIIGDAGTSRAWWKYELGRSEEEWREWYEKRIKNPLSDHLILRKASQ